MNAVLQSGSASARIHRVVVCVCFIWTTYQFDTGLHLVVLMLDLRVCRNAYNSVIDEITSQTMKRPLSFSSHRVSIIPIQNMRQMLLSAFNNSRNPSKLTKVIHSKDSVHVVQSHAVGHTVFEHVSKYSRGDTKSYGTLKSSATPNLARRRELVSAGVLLQFPKNVFHDPYCQSLNFRRQFKGCTTFEITMQLVDVGYMPKYPGDFGQLFSSCLGFLLFFENGNSVVGILAQQVSRSDSVFRLPFNIHLFMLSATKDQKKRAESMVVTVYKRCASSECENHRGVSLTPDVKKLFAPLILRLLKKTHDDRTGEQQGEFRQGWDCVHCILQSTSLRAVLCVQTSYTCSVP
ncbi:protein kinase [Clonorchis sinensis]|uniref:Protein kinase n=1 Tax=Clonorchis sinensis TaxID=79923 RepID=G7YRN5_CLOSI|nr:protein kinase [Clonorchis sinensis]